MSVMKPNNPADDYKVWLVVDPSKWLVPIWMAVLVVALAVHAYVLPSAKYNFFDAPARAAQAK